LRRADTARLVLLAAIWGASFLFSRITAPVLGPVLTAELRTLIAGIALAVYFGFAGFNPEWRRWGRQYVIVGILTSALPFLLWAYAALSLTAGLMSVLNATSPMWGALWSAVLLGERLNARRVVGLVIGVVGVALVTPPKPGELAPVFAALGAAFCYGLAGATMKRWASGVPSRGMAVGTQLAAGVLLIPFIALSPPTTAPTPLVMASMLALGLVCGAIAYLVLSPHRRHRRDRRAHRHLSHPGVRRAVGGALPGRSIVGADARRRRARGPRHGFRVKKLGS
jgi:drug/metabolite transporter (DMT)-like permease